MQGFIARLEATSGNFVFLSSGWVTGALDAVLQTRGGAIDRLKGYYCISPKKKDGSDLLWPVDQQLQNTVAAIIASAVRVRVSNASC